MTTAHLDSSARVNSDQVSCCRTDMVVGRSSILLYICLLVGGKRAGHRTIADDQKGVDLVGIKKPRNVLGGQILASSWSVVSDVKPEIAGSKEHSSTSVLPVNHHSSHSGSPNIIEAPFKMSI